MGTLPGRFIHSKQQLKGRRVALQPLETENVPKRKLQFAEAPCAQPEPWIEVEIRALLEFILFYAKSPDAWPSFSHCSRFWPEAANFLTKRTAGQSTRSGTFGTFIYTCVYTICCSLR